MLPAEERAFVDKFGYKPFAIRVATGSVGSLGKTASSVILVDKDNPIAGLTLAQLNAIYGTDRRRGEKKEIKNWGDLGLKGVREDRPIHLYGLGSRQVANSRLISGHGCWKAAHTSPTFSSPSARVSRTHSTSRSRTWRANRVA